MQKPLYGRHEEKAKLNSYIVRKSSDMIAIVGRRRVGKTYLVRQALGQKIDFEITGYQYATKSIQLQNFIMCLSKYTDTAMITQTPKNWLEAFHQLKIYLSLKKKNEKKIIFIDELPWIASAKSGFTEALAHFWNDWASENNVLLIVCGSAASWMLKNIVHNKGGLHNRITETIRLEPFTLKEVKEYIKAEKIKATDKEIAELYMVLGGVPYYLSLLKRGKSIEQNIQELLFNNDGRLKQEFNEIFLSLFDKSSNHLQILNVLAAKFSGLSRLELSNLYQGKDGGGLSQVLEELLLSGFIQKIQAYGKVSKDGLYRITDPYILFYKKFLATKKLGVEFSDIKKTSSYKSWCGYAFENLCLYNIKAVQKKLHNSKTTSYSCSYFHKGNKTEQGYQIDLLVDRNDGVINMCEIKWSTTIFTIDKKYATQLKHRLEHFGKKASEKNIHLTFITSNGLLKNEYAKELVDKSIELQDLF